MATIQFDSKSAHTLHQSITKALKFGEMLQRFPMLIEEAIDHEVWRFRTCRAKGRPFSNLIEYLEHNEPDGCQVSKERVEQLIAKDAAVLTKWRKAVTGADGVRHGYDNITTSHPITGTSRAYTLDRLSREAPHLHAAVCAGELSANAAAIQAGFRKKPTAFDTVRKLLPKLTAEERAELAHMLKGNQIDRKAG